MKDFIRIENMKEEDKKIIKDIEYTEKISYPHVSQVAVLGTLDKWESNGIPKTIETENGCYYSEKIVKKLIYYAFLQGRKLMKEKILEEAKEISWYI